MQYSVYRIGPDAQSSKLYCRNDRSLITAIGCHVLLRSKMALTWDANEASVYLQLWVSKADQSDLDEELKELKNDLKTDLDERFEEVRDDLEGEIMR